MPRWTQAAVLPLQKWAKAPRVQSGAAVAPTAMRADAEVRRQKQRLGRGVGDAPKVMDSRLIAKGFEWAAGAAGRAGGSAADATFNITNGLLFIVAVFPTVGVDVV